MLKRLPICVMLLTLAACGGRKEEPFTYNTDPGKDSSIVIEVIPDTLKAPSYVYSDTVVLEVDSRGKAKWSDRQIKTSDLQREIQDSLLDVYLHTGKLPETLEVKYDGKVAGSRRSEADDKIAQAQEVVKNVVSVAEYKRPFGQLVPADQDSLQKKYPALFARYR